MSKVNHCSNAVNQPIIAPEVIPKSDGLQEARTRLTSASTVANCLDTLKIRSIEAGRHSSAISNDGRLFVWGPVFSDESNPLILPQELKSNKTMKAISIGCSLTAVVDQEGHLYTWGTSNRFG